MTAEKNEKTGSQKSGSVFFHSQVNGFRVVKPAAIKKWILLVLKREKEKCGEINFVFVDDECLLKVNQQYLKHDYYTDVITFDWTEKGEAVSGDIYLSVDRIKENAEKENVPFISELRRVMIHGILHLAGYKDKTKSDKSEMTKAENRYLTLFNL